VASGNERTYGVVLQKGSPMTRGVNAAVRALVANGTLTGSSAAGF
jgi:hypothetical protein